MAKTCGCIGKTTTAVSSTTTATVTVTTTTTDTDTTITTTTITTTTLYDSGNVDCIERQDDCTAACEAADNRNYAVLTPTNKRGKACRGPADCTPGDGACPTTTTTTATTTESSTSLSTSSVTDSVSLEQLVSDLAAICSAEIEDCTNNEACAAFLESKMSGGSEPPSIETAKAAGKEAVAVWTCATSSASGFPTDVGRSTSTVASKISIKVLPTTPDEKDRIGATNSISNISDGNDINGNSSALDASRGGNGADSDDLGVGSSAGLIGGGVAIVVVALALTVFFVRRAKKANAAMAGHQPSLVVHNQAYTAHGSTIPGQLGSGGAPGCRGTATQALPGFATATPTAPLVPSRPRSALLQKDGAETLYEEPIKKQMVDYDKVRRLSSTEYATCEESSGIAVAAAGSGDSVGLKSNPGNGNKVKEKKKGKKKEGKGGGPDRCPKCNAKIQFCTCNVRRGTLDMAPPRGKRKGDGSGDLAAQNVGTITRASDRSAAGVDYENLVVTPSGVTNDAGQDEYDSTQGVLHQHYKAASSDEVDYANTVDDDLSGSQEYDIVETAFVGVGNGFGVDSVYATVDGDDGNKSNNTVDDHLSGNQEYDIVETAFVGFGNGFGVDSVYATVDGDDGNKTVDDQLSGNQEYDIVETAFVGFGNGFGVDSVYATVDGDDGNKTVDDDAFC